MRATTGLCLLAVLLVLAGACGPNGRALAGPTPSPMVANCAPASAPFGTDGIWLSNADSGCAARLHPGDQVFVELHVAPGYSDWTDPVVSDSRSLQEEPVFWSAPAGVTPAHFRAGTPGAVTLTASSQTTCASDLVACPRHIRTWHVAVSVVL
jgi:hypothetical protein